VTGKGGGRERKTVQATRNYGAQKLMFKKPKTMPKLFLLQVKLKLFHVFLNAYGQYPRTRFLCLSLFYLKNEDIGCPHMENVANISHCTSI
jgi:hypothetical protein